jgi:hypothetical protein
MPRRGIFPETEFPGSHASGLLLVDAKRAGKGFVPPLIRKMLRLDEITLHYTGAGS